MSSSNNNSQLRTIEAQTLDERIESKLSYADKNHKPDANIEAVLTRPEGSYLLKEWYFGANIVCDTGDVFYAQRGAGETPTDNFAGANGRFILRTTADTPNKADTYTGVLGPISASNNTYTNTYPKTNDTGDPDNTGDGPKVVSWACNWTTTSFSDLDIEGGCIHNGGGTPAGNLLTHFTITQFAKTTSDTLKVFVNHAIAGV